MGVDRGSFIPIIFDLMTMFFFCSTLSEFENFLLCERILINVTTCKTKRQANFKDFKRFGAFKGLVEQKNVVFNSFLCQLGFFGTRGPLKRSFHSRCKLAHSCQKTPIYTRTRQINYYFGLVRSF
jgi:hypothetical protein